jgi:hypothetical protein
VAHWKLDETTGLTAVDELGNSDGTLINMTGNEWIAGQDGNAIDMSAATDTSYIMVPNNAIVDFDSTESFTASALIFLNDWPADGKDVLIKGHTGVDSRIGAEGKWYKIEIKPYELRFTVDDNVTKTQLGTNVFGIFPFGSWVHVVGVRDLGADSLYLYLNGVKICDMEDITERDISSSLPLIIGNNHNHNNVFPGKIDDVRLYNYALNADQVKELFDSYDITTGIDDESGAKSLTYKLMQNYPNPFNPQTNIQFQIPKDGHVTISVYNTLGQRVETLFDENIRSGMHNVTFDAAKFTSGIYFYKIKARDFTKVRKMMLLK